MKIIKVKVSWLLYLSFAHLGMAVGKNVFKYPARSKFYKNPLGKVLGFKIKTHSDLRCIWDLTFGHLLPEPNYVYIYYKLL